MRTMKELLEAHPFFAGLDDEAIELVVGCATNVHFDPDEYLFRLGDPADRFYVVRHGRVALELHVPGSGQQVVDTVEEDQVLGWSWLVPPHHRFLDARAVVPSSAISLDGVCIRTKCDDDPVLGYAFMQRVAQVMYQRLQSARVRLLDLYGGGRAAER